MGNHSETSRWITKGLNEYSRYYEKKELSFCNYFFVLSECFFLGGFYSECLELLEYMQNPKWKKYFNNYPVDLGYYEVAKVMIAISNLKIGNSSKGKQILKETNTGSFVFTKSKLYTLFYLSEQLNFCGASAKRKKEKILNQIDRLVRDTGFIYFSFVAN